MPWSTVVWEPEGGKSHNHTVYRGWRVVRLRLQRRGPKMRKGEWEKSKEANRNMK